MRIIKFIILITFLFNSTAYPYENASSALRAPLMANNEKEIQRLRAATEKVSWRFSNSKSMLPFFFTTSLFIMLPLQAQVASLAREYHNSPETISVAYTQDRQVTQDETKRLTEIAKTGNAQARLVALHSLNDINSIENNIEIFTMAALYDENSNIREYASEILTKNDNLEVKKEISKLIERLGSDNTRRQSAINLIKIGKQAVVPLLKTLRDENYHSLDALLSIIDVLDKTKDSRAVFGLTNVLTGIWGDDPDVQTHVLRALKNMWPASKIAIPSLIDVLARGNSEALWILDEDPMLVKELGPAIIRVLTLGTGKNIRVEQGIYTYTEKKPISKSWLNVPHGFRYGFFGKMDKKIFNSIIKEASQRDKNLLLILYLTDQSIPLGITDAEYLQKIKNGSIQREAYRIFNNPALSGYLNTLSELSPYDASNFLAAILEVRFRDEGPINYSTWASQDQYALTKSIRCEALLARSTIVKLLAKEGYGGIFGKRDQYWAEFKWSEWPAMVFNFPPIVWTEEDIAYLKELTNNKDYRYHANRVLKEIEEQNRKFENVEKLIEALKSEKFTDRYQALHMLSLREEIPETIVPYLTKALNENNFWMQELAKSILIKMGKLNSSEALNSPSKSVWREL